MKIVVVGAGVMAASTPTDWNRSGHDVTLLARGQRLADLDAHGLNFEEAGSGLRSKIFLPLLSQPRQDNRFDLALAPVRSEQLASTLPVLNDMADFPTVLFLAIPSGTEPSSWPRWATERVSASLRPVASGMAWSSGTCSSSSKRPMLGEAGGTSTPRVRRLQPMFGDAGFPTDVSTNISGWMLGHSAFVVHIGFALYRFDGHPTALAADASTLRLMVRATEMPSGAGPRRDPDKPSVALPPDAYGLRCSLLASGPRKSPWRTVVRGPQSRRSRRDALARSRAPRAVRRAGTPTSNFDALSGLDPYLRCPAVRPEGPRDLQLQAGRRRAT